MYVFLLLLPNKLFYCIYKDRFYTVHNVWGASIGTAILAHYNRKKFENQELTQSIEEKVEILETNVVDNQECMTKL
jgi:hypothetical protein